MQIDAMIVGTGLTGSTIARKLAEAGKKVLMLEQRNHIGGNVYDEIEDDILVQRYGPHLFYTEFDEVYEFLSLFTTFEPYLLKAASCVDGKNLPMPFNFSSIDFFYEKTEAARLKNKLLQAYPQKQAAVFDLMRSADRDIRKYGKLLFEKDYRLYSAKQWGIAPERIDPEILARVPVFFSYRDTRFAAKHQALPKGGFTKMVKEMLAHPNINVELNTDALEHLSLDAASGKAFYDGQALSIPVVYTGAIDALWHRCYGVLPYRSLHITYEKQAVKSYLEYAAIAYPQAEGFVRKTEYTKLPWQDAGEKTIIATEYPLAYDIQDKGAIGPAYPILTAENKALYHRYLELGKKVKNLYVCGRLGDYRYYDMDQAVKRAMNIVSEGFV